MHCPFGAKSSFDRRWTLHGDMMSPVVKHGSALYIVPGCMTLKPRRARYMSFWSSNSQRKVHLARFGWKMGCTKFRDSFLN